MRLSAARRADSWLNSWADHPTMTFWLKGSQWHRSMLVKHSSLSKLVCSWFRRKNASSRKAGSRFYSLKTLYAVISCLYVGTYQLTKLYQWKITHKQCSRTNQKLSLVITILTSCIGRSKKRVKGVGLKQRPITFWHWLIGTLTWLMQSALSNKVATTLFAVMRKVVGLMILRMALVSLASWQGAICL